MCVEGGEGEGGGYVNSCSLKTGSLNIDLKNPVCF